MKWYLFKLPEVKLVFKINLTAHEAFSAEVAKSYHMLSDSELLPFEI